MYVWQCAIFEDVYIGRTWDSFKEFIYELCTQNDVSLSKRIVIYVHNLSFEFSFIQHLFEWYEKGQLMIESRKPCKICTTGGVEFRCSYLLSNAPLSQLNSKKWHKLQGDLDYKLSRNAKTPLSDVELGYCINDVLVLTEYIKNEMEHYGNIVKIPKTSTGAVRNYCKQECVIKEKLYRETMKELTLEVDEYAMLRQCFQGGFTHASMIHSNVTQYDVTSFDFTSSYPSVMVSEKFPMSKGVKFGNITVKQYEEICKDYCVMATVVFKNIKEKLDFEHPLSVYKCQGFDKMKSDNGRVIEADVVMTIITEQDYEVLKDFYNWDDMYVLRGYYYIKAYLPKPFIKCILDFYQGKTTLKGVSDKEDEYMRKKAMLNSCYGMCVTDIVKPTNVYDNKNGWITEEPDFDKSIASYNSSKMRFLYYPWGVWVTAYARRNLFSGIKECQYDYIYADTDSVKIKNPQLHQEYFNSYNNEIIQKIRRMADRYNIPYELIEPKTIKGECKPLGVWDFDGHYKEFKTCGAKRYITIDDDDNLHLTVSGVQKKSGQKWMIETFGTSENAVEHFKDGLIFPPEGTGKSVHTYIDDMKEFDDVDYLGNECHIIAPSGTHLEETSYDMSIAETYKQLLNTIMLGRCWG